MDRRSFFRTMIGGVAAAAVVRTFPFRVFSFPSEISLASHTATGIQVFNSEALKRLAVIYYDKEALELLKQDITFEAFDKPFIHSHGREINLLKYELRAPQGLYAN